MNKALIIRSEEQANLVCEVIKTLPFEPVHEVIIKPHKKNRTLAQNAIYWKWLTILASEYGDLKEDRAEYYKEKFLVNIYIRDDESYNEMVQAIRLIKKEGMLAEYESIKKAVLDLTSTTNASVKQFSEYLDSIEKHAHSLGIGFVQDELYREAHGKR